MSVPPVLGGLVAHAAFPALLGGSLWLARVLHAAGLAAPLAATLTFLVVLVLTVLLEHAFPSEPRWCASAARSYRRDLTYLALAGGLQSVGKLAGEAAAGLLALGLALALGRHDGLTALPSPARALLAFALADLGKYAIHRGSHERPRWWRFHAEHHAPDAVHARNATRLHPVNLLWNVGLDALGVAAFGLDAGAALDLAVFRSTVAILQHANVRFAPGPLDLLVSTPAVHRWHHSRVAAEANANYGATLLVWDLLFGTRRVPADRRGPEEVGLFPGSAHPEGLVAQLLWPFRRRAQVGGNSHRGSRSR